MTAFTNDTRSSSGSLTTTSKSSAGAFTQTSRSIDYLWASTTLPWQLDYPWQQDGGDVFDFLTKN